MSAFKSGNARRRGPWDMTPLLVLLLVLLSGLPGPAVSQEEEDVEGDGEVAPEEPAEEETPAAEEDAPADEATEEPPVIEDHAEEEGLPPSSYDGEPVSESPSAMPDDATATPDPNLLLVSPGEDVNTEEGSGSGMYRDGDPTDAPTDDTNPLIILIPVVLVVVIIAMVVGGIVINRRWSRKTSYTTDHEKGDPYLDDTTEKVPMPMFEEDVPSVLELEMDELDQWMNKDGGLQTTVASKQIEL